MINQSIAIHNKEAVLCSQIRVLYQYRNKELRPLRRLRRARILGKINTLRRLRDGGLK